MGQFYGIEKKSAFMPARLAAGFLAAAVGAVAVWQVKESQTFKHEPVRVIASEVQIGNRIISDPFAFIKPLPGDNADGAVSHTTTNAWIAAAQEVPAVPKKNFREIVTPEEIAKAKKAYQIFLTETDPRKKFKAIRGAIYDIGANTDLIGVMGPNFLAQLRDSGRDALPLLLKDIENNPDDVLSNFERTIEAIDAFYRAGSTGVFDDLSGFSSNKMMSESNTGVSLEVLHEMHWEIGSKATKAAIDGIRALGRVGDLRQDQLSEYDRLDEILIRSGGFVLDDEKMNEEMVDKRRDFYTRYEMHIDELGNRTFTVRPHTHSSIQPRP